MHKKSKTKIRIEQLKSLKKHCNKELHEERQLDQVNKETLETSSSLALPRITYPSFKYLIGIFLTLCYFHNFLVYILKLPGQ